VYDFNTNNNNNNTLKSNKYDCTMDQELRQNC